MIIQCPSCSTKFSLDTSALAGVQNPRFHCSRCDHFFESLVEPPGSVTVEATAGGDAAAVSDVPQGPMVRSRPAERNAAASVVSADSKLPTVSDETQGDIGRDTDPAQPHSTQEASPSAPIASEQQLSLLDSGSGRMFTEFASRDADGSSREGRRTSAYSTVRSPAELLGMPTAASPAESSPNFEPGRSRIGASESGRALRKGLPDGFDLEDSGVAVAPWPEHTGTNWLEADLSELHATLVGDSPLERGMDDSSSVHRIEPSSRVEQRDKMEERDDAERRDGAAAQPYADDDAPFEFDDSLAGAHASARALLGDFDDEELRDSSEPLSPASVQGSSSSDAAYSVPPQLSDQDTIRDLESIPIRQTSAKADTGGFGSPKPGWFDSDAPVRGGERTVSRARELIGETTSSGGLWREDSGRADVARAGGARTTEEVPVERPFEYQTAAPAMADLPHARAAVAENPTQKANKVLRASPPGTARRWRNVVAVSAVPVSLALVCGVLSRQLQHVPPLVQETLHLRPEGVPKLPPPGLDVVDVESSFVTLDDGQKVLEIRGQLLNATTKSFGRVKLEARVFDAANVELGKMITDAQSHLVGARLPSLSAASIEKMQQERSTSFIRLNPSDKIPFRIVFADGVKSVSADQIRWYSARVYSTETS